MSELWQELLSDLDATKTPVETPIATQQPNILTPQLNNPTIQTPQIQTPGITLPPITQIQSEIFQNVAPALQEHYQEQVNRIQNPTIELTPLNPDVPDDDDNDEDNDDDEDDELQDALLNPDEEGIDGETTPNNFNLSLPNNIAPPTLNLGLNNLALPQSEPRKVGRPRKVETAATLLNETLPSITAQDYNKSSGISEQPLSQTNTQAKAYTVTVPKSTLKEIGESLQRIANAIIEISKN